MLLDFIFVAFVPLVQVVPASIAIQLHMLCNALGLMLALMGLHGRVVPITFVMGICGLVCRRWQPMVCRHAHATAMMLYTSMYILCFVHTQPSSMCNSLSSIFS
jgi:hypothetical protein